MLALAYSDIGGFGATGNPDVQALQQALKDLAVAANYPIGDPGAADGIVGQKTVGALASWSSKIAQRISLPGAVSTALQLAAIGYPLLTESQRRSVQDAIAQYAKELTIGVRGVIAIYQATVSPPPGPALNPASFTSFAMQAGGLRTGAGGAPAGGYKAGSFARFNETRSVWSVYSPLAGAQGLGVATMGRCLFGDCLGEGEVDPPVPPGFVKAGEEPAPPAGVPQAGSERDKKPFYKNPYFWLGVGGVAVVGTGGYYVLRRRRAA